MIQDVTRFFSEGCTLLVCFLFILMFYFFQQIETIQLIELFFLYLLDWFYQLETSIRLSIIFFLSIEIINPKM